MDDGFRLSFHSLVAGRCRQENSVVGGTVAVVIAAIVLSLASPKVQ